MGSIFLEIIALPSLYSASSYSKLKLFSLSDDAIIIKMGNLLSNNRITQQPGFNFAVILGICTIGLIWHRYNKK